MLPTPAPRPTNTDGEAGSSARGTSGVFYYVSTLLFQSYLTDRQILINTTKMVNQLDKLINFFSDNRVRGEQSQEEESIKRPVGSSGDDGLVGALKDTIGFITIKAAVLAIGTAITMLADDIQSTVRQTVAYLALARTQTIDAVKAVPGIVKSILGTVGDVAAGLRDGVLIELEAQGVKVVRAFEAVADSRAVGAFVRAFEGVYRAVRLMTAPLIRITEVFLKPMIALFEGIGRLGMQALSVVAKGASKIFLPLQVLLSTIDFVNGFIEGYERSGVKEGIRTGLVKVFDGLFIAVIDIAKRFVAWVLDLVGMDQLAASLRKEIDRIVVDLRGVFSGIVDIFLGLVTLDGKQVWDGLKTGFSSLGMLVLHNVTAMIDFVVNFVRDMFGIEGEPFDLLKSSFVDSIVGILTSFATAVADWLKESLRAVVVKVAGDKVANQVFGAKQITESDVAARADSIAKGRALDSIDPGARLRAASGQDADLDKLKYAVTDEDKKKAREELAREGYVDAPEVKIDDQQFQKIDKILNDTSTKNESKTDVTVNNTKITNGAGAGGSRPVVIPVPMQEKASQSNPVRRSN
jgi:hypothetical protein